MEQPQSILPVFNIFGSATSRDIDFLVQVESPVRPQDIARVAKEYESQLRPLLSPDGSRELDCNLGVVENGVLIWVYKGTCDIVSNKTL